MKPLTFPLCLLSFQDTIKERMQYIIHYCVVTRLSRIKEKTINEILQKITPPRDFNPDNDIHRMIIVNAYELGISLGSVVETIAEGNKALQFVIDYERRYGSDAWAQVDMKLVFDTRNGAFNYNSFSILCAVTSILGKEADKFKIIASEQIQCRMNGFKTSAILEEEVRLRELKIIDLPYKQLLRKIDAVSKLGYFHKYTFRKKHTYYSSYLKKEQIMKAVYNRKYYAKRKAVRDKALDKAFEKALEEKLENVSNDIQEEIESQTHKTLK
jgi:hypothetical protein